MDNLSFLLVLFYPKKVEMSLNGPKFLECMGDVKPKAIMTDQCRSIQIGVDSFFGADTLHRNCSWHILHKLTDHWGGVKGKKDRTAKINDIVYNSLSVSEFESRWEEAMKEFDKVEDPWFIKIYNDRDRWVPVYLNNSF